MSNIQVASSNKELYSFLEKYKKQISLALPSHITSERMMRLVITEFSKNPDLKKCSLKSIFSSVIQASQLGLEPGGTLGHAYLIPYRDTCQFQLGYKGMIELARRSGQIISLSANVVKENDYFEYEYGLDEKLKHIPARSERGNLVYGYAIAKISGGGYQFEVMPKEEIDSIKRSSKGANSSYSPWSTHYEEMAKKTVVRRLFKYLPISVEIQKAIGHDEIADIGKQDLASEFNIIDHEECETISTSDKIASLIDSSKGEIENA